MIFPKIASTSGHLTDTHPSPEDEGLVALWTSVWKLTVRKWGAMMTRIFRVSCKTCQESTHPAFSTRVQGMTRWWWSYSKFWRGDDDLDLLINLSLMAKFEDKFPLKGNSTDKPCISVPIAVGPNGVACARASLGGDRDIYIKSDEFVPSESTIPYLWQHVHGYYY